MLWQVRSPQVRQIHAEIIRVRVRLVAVLSVCVVVWALMAYAMIPPRCQEPLIGCVIRPPVVLAVGFGGVTGIGYDSFRLALGTLALGGVGAICLFLKRRLLFWIGLAVFVGMVGFAYQGGCHFIKARVCRQGRRIPNVQPTPLRNEFHPRRWKAELCQQGG